MSDKILFYETDHWDIYLARTQAYLGYCGIYLKRKAKTMSEINPEEWRDFQQLVKKLESALKSSFKATMFNWACLMNMSYRNDPPTPQVHWHFIPRYRNEVKFAGEVFPDTEFGGPADFYREKIVSEEVLKQIIDEIKKHL